MLLERGKKFVERTLSAREEIAQLGARFIKHDMVSHTSLCTTLIILANMRTDSSSSFLQ